jgi:cyclopropane-fatty-acyl-phospholipid synthase
MSTCNQGASRESIQHHYDLSDKFYSLWLDSTMTYSCAMWRQGDSLELAQERKIDYHLDNARVGRGGRLLDIGCGWGAALSRGVSRCGVSMAVGLTMSKTQADHIRNIKVPGLSVQETTWQEFRPDREFDGIISVGAFEHFAKPDLTDSQMVDAYEEFFEKCRVWLKPGGCLSLQTIAYGSTSRKNINQFILNEIFPESDLPVLSQIMRALERKFEVISLRNDRQDYAETFGVWSARLKRNREEAACLIGEEKVEQYLKYQGMFAIGFHTGAMNLYRLHLRRQR